MNKTIFFYFLTLFLSIIALGTTGCQKKTVDEIVLESQSEYLISKSFGSFNNDEQVFIVPMHSSLQYSVSTDNFLQLTLSYSWNDFSVTFLLDHIPATVKKQRISFDKGIYACRVTFLSAEEESCDAIASGEIALVKDESDPFCRIYLEGTVCGEPFSFMVHGITQDSSRVQYKQFTTPIVEWRLWGKDIIVNETGHFLSLELEDGNLHPENSYDFEPGQSLEIPVYMEDDPEFNLSLSSATEATLTFGDGKTIRFNKDSWPENLLFPANVETIRNDHFFPEGFPVAHPISKRAYILTEKIYNDGLTSPAEE